MCRNSELKLLSFKIGYYMFKIFYVSHMITTKENPLEITQNNTIKKSKHNDTKNIKMHTKRWQNKKQGTVDLQNNQKTIN